MNQANLDRLFNPVNEGMDRSLKLTLADIARQQQLRDADQARQFVTERDTVQNQRQVEAAKKNQEFLTDRDKALDEQTSRRQRAMKLIELARMGVALPDNATDAQIAKAEREHMTTAAKRVIGVFDKEADDNQKEYEAEVSKYNKTFSKAASLEAKQAALAAVIADPTIRAMLGKKELDKLKAAMTSGDPERAVADVAAYIGENYWISSTKKAQKLTDAFKEPLLASLTGERATELQQIGSKLQSLQANQNLINKQRYDAARQHVAWLDDEDYKRLVAPTAEEGGKKKAIPDNPDSVMDESGATEQDLAGSLQKGREILSGAPSIDGQGQDLMGTLQKGRELLANLPDDIKQKIKSTALQLGVPQQEIEFKDNLLQTADINDPRLPQIVTETNRLLQAVTGQTAGVPPVGQTNVASDGLDEWRNQRVKAKELYERVKKFQIPDPFEKLQIPDPFAR